MYDTYDNESWAMFLLENMCVVSVAEVALQVIWVPVTINLKTWKYSNWTKHKHWWSILKHKQYFKIEQNIQDPSENIQTYLNLNKNTIYPSENVKNYSSKKHKWH